MAWHTILQSNNAILTGPGNYKLHVLTFKSLSMGYFMNSKTIVKKRLIPFIAFIFIVTGCMFQKPDFLQMITATELNQIMQNKHILLVDVHVPEQQHIKGTDLFIPFNEIETYKDKFPKDKNTAIYLYCEGGPMGNAAARSLYKLGYRNLFNLEGGTKAWRKAGFDFE
jgi:rhodanese-related sulfurtransferase